MLYKALIGALIVCIIGLVGLYVYIDKQTSEKLLLEEQLKNRKVEYIQGESDTVTIVKWKEKKEYVTTVIKENGATAIDTTISDDSGVVINLYSSDVRTEPIGVLYNIPERIVTVTRIDTINNYIEKPVLREPTLLEKSQYAAYGAIVALGGVCIYIIAR